MLQSLLRGTSMPRSGTKALLCVLRVHGSKGKKWRAWWHHHGGQVRRFGRLPSSCRALDDLGHAIRQLNDGHAFDRHPPSPGK